jgi:hypothetical protein
MEADSNRELRKDVEGKEAPREPGTFILPIWAFGLFDTFDPVWELVDGSTAVPASKKVVGSQQAPHDGVQKPAA